MLRGVLNGVIKNTPVLTLDKTDVKRLNLISSYLPGRVTSTYSLRDDGVVELVVWRKRAMIFVYFNEDLIFSGPPMRSNMRTDLELLHLARESGILHMRNTGGETLRIILKPAGKAALSVWLDQVLEQM